YGRLAGRFAGAPVDDGGGGLPFPQYPRPPRADGDIWFLDLLEWGHGGGPGRVGPALVGDLRYPHGIPRRAVNLILDVSAARAGGQIGADALARGAQSLGELQSYAALAPLERLYGHDDARVRRASVRALRHLYFKRSFGLLQKGLR